MTAVKEGPNASITAVNSPQNVAKEGKQAIMTVVINTMLGMKETKSKGKEQKALAPIQISSHSPFHSQLEMSDMEPYPEKMASEKVQLLFTEVTKPNKPRAISEGDIQTFF